MIITNFSILNIHIFHLNLRISFLPGSCLTVIKDPSVLLRTCLEWVNTQKKLIALLDRCLFLSTQKPWLNQPQLGNIRSARACVISNVGAVMFRSYEYGCILYLLHIWQGHFHAGAWGLLYRVTFFTNPLSISPGRLERRVLQKCVLCIIFNEYLTTFVKVFSDSRTWHPWLS